MGKELYANIPSRVGDLLADVKNGRIGLPDLQRPFVWQDNKVRELLDSMLKGYPIGYIMLWSSPDDFDKAGQIGKNNKMFSQPDDLVIDGQQRLTALLAALYGVSVRDKNYKERKIKIAYNPLSREFQVWSKTYDTPEWIKDISKAFEADENHELSKFRRTFIRDLNEYRAKNEKSSLTIEEEDCIEDNIKNLLDLKLYFLPTLKINSKASEEDVADIFVRVNSGGQKLTEKNFIETLIAVYDNDVHKKIDEFCAQSRIPSQGTSYNQIIEVDPAHLIRMAVGVGFKRARLRYAYMLLRGKNLKTGITTKETREENLSIFKSSLDRVTDLNDWHAFMNLFAKSGYVNGNMVASTNAVVFSYVLYLIGKYDYKVPSVKLQRIICKWIYMSTITGFYTGSTESEVEKQFADLRGVTEAEDFISYLDSIIKTRFTDDFFTYTLPQDLNSSSAISPTWYGYIAAINVLGKPMLFSTVPQANYMILGSSGDKNAIDKHHIFPKNYLEKIGYTDDRDRNQIANFTYLEYAINIDISDDPPAEYVGRYKEKLGIDGYKLSCEQNALPENFENLEYQEFLSQRRVLMAQIIKKAYLELCKMDEVNE